MKLFNLITNTFDFWFNVYNVMVFSVAMCIRGLCIGGGYMVKYQVGRLYFLNSGVRWLEAFVHH